MSKQRILIIEDDPNIREVMIMALQFEGFEVYSASNGKEGLEALESGPRPNLILLDLMMPVMSGWEFIDNFKQLENFKNIPVVIVSAFFEKAKTVECTAFVPKPVDLETLLEHVRRHIEK
jgi:two-component system chemotaxis response regulator CheY